MKRFAIAIGLLAGACTVGSDALTYEEFKAQAYQEEETGIYIINGDEIAVDENAMFDVYQLYLESHYAAIDDGYSSTEQFSIVNRVNGRDDVWSASTAANLTYCVSQSSFGSRYSAVVSAMANATAAWEGTANVNFVHASQYDSSCSKSTSCVWKPVPRTWKALAPLPFAISSEMLFACVLTESLSEKLGMALLWICYKR